MSSITLELIGKIPVRLELVESSRSYKSENGIYARFDEGS